MTFFSDRLLEVFILAPVSQAFLPSKKACGTHTFRHLGVRQQYPPVTSTRAVSFAEVVFTRHLVIPPY